MPDTDRAALERLAREATRCRCLVESGAGGYISYLSDPYCLTCKGTGRAPNRLADAVLSLLAERDGLRKVLQAVEQRQASRPAWYHDGTHWHVTDFTHEQMEGNREVILALVRKALEETTRD